MYPRYSTDGSANTLFQFDLDVVTFHPRQGPVEMLHVTVPCTAANEHVVEANDGIVATLEDVFHQAREGGRTGLQTHRSDRPNKLAPSGHSESRKSQALLRQLQLPVCVHHPTGAGRYYSLLE